MIYKVLYQDTLEEYPIRERTKALYLEAESVRDVRIKLADRKINIEYIQQLSEIHLQFEQQSDQFELETV